MRMSHSSLFLLIIAAQLALTGGPCARTGDLADCSAEPTGRFVAFVDAPSAPPLARWHGVVTGLSSADQDGFSRITVRVEGAAADSVIKFQAGDETVPVTIGRVYDFQVEHIGGAPPLSSLVVSDDGGLVFAGAGDQTIGGHVLKGGLPGFEFRLEPTGCPGRGSSTCYTAIINSRLDVTRAGQTVSLWNGHAGGLGPYRVACLAAQKVTYTARCPDAGLVGVSWVVSRGDSTG